MKKISLKVVRNSLRRDEMRSIIGSTKKADGSCISDKNCSSGCSDGYYCSDCGTCAK
jgi:hypothetical protein